MRKLLVIVVGCLLLFSFGTTFAAAPKTWTFLIYLNGNNNLDDYGLENIEAMEKVGSNDQVNIVVQWASLSAQKTVRLLIQKNKLGKKSHGITSPVVEDIGNVDMGDVKTLDDFIKWGVAHYPAQHYFINVWDHGSGWHLKGRKLHQRAISGFDVSWDENTGNFITTEQLGQAMARAAQVIGHKVDIFGSDACLMAMAEVVNEMSDSVSVFVGSQEVEPARGWPYDTFLAHWLGTSDATAEQVVKYLVKDYIASYGNYGDVTLSAFDLNKMADLNKAVTAFGSKLRQLNAKERKAVLREADDAQRFSYTDYADVIDFINQLNSANIKSLDKETLINLKKSAKEFVIANDTGADMKKAHGLSLWIPDSWSYDKYKARYAGLKFNAATEWGETLAVLLQGTH